MNNSSYACPRSTAGFRFSIVIPARDEERFIGKCLESIRVASAPYPGQVEVIVALNRCTDRTEAIAASFGARTVSVEARNLAAVRNAGAGAATGSVVVTIDADSVMSPNTLAEIDRHLTTGKFIGGGTMIWPERLSLGILCTGLLVVLLVARYRVSAGLFWLYREDFVALGGFDESFVSAEDVDFAIRLRTLGRTRGKRFGTLHRAFITTSCRKFDYFGDWSLIRNVGLVRNILGGKDQATADLFYYDVPR